MQQIRQAEMDARVRAIEGALDVQIKNKEALFYRERLRQVLWKSSAPREADDTWRVIGQEGTGRPVAIAPDAALPKGYLETGKTAGQIAAEGVMQSREVMFDEVLAGRSPEGISPQLYPALRARAEAYQKKIEAEDSVAGIMKVWAEVGDYSSHPDLIAEARDAVKVYDPVKLKLFNVVQEFVRGPDGEDVVIRRLHKWSPDNPYPSEQDLAARRARILPLTKLIGNAMAIVKAERRGGEEYAQLVAQIQALPLPSRESMEAARESLPAPEGVA